jgi:CheY-like chemotaxis protein
MENAYDHAIAKIKRAIGRPGKILIAEDEELTRTILSGFFKEHGYTVFEGMDGEEALTAYKEHQDISLIITDIKMPKMDGIELIRAIREENKTIPIIILTAYPDYEGLHKIEFTGWIALVEKPFELTDIESIFNAFSKGE